MDCDTSEGYVTEEDETIDAEQLKKSGKRVSLCVCACVHSPMN